MDKKPETDLSPCGYERESILAKGRDLILQAYETKTGDKKVIKVLGSKQGGPFNPYEVCVQSTIKHPFITPISKLLSNKSCTIDGIGVVYSFASHNYMKTIPTQTYHNKLVSFYQIILGLKYLHKCGYLHLDIKYDNFLLFGDISKITDMGNARSCKFPKIGKSLKSLTGIGTLFYMSPKILSGNSREGIVYNAADDIWALGIALITMLCNKTIFTSKVIKDSNNGIVIAPIIEYYKDVLYDDSHMADHIENLINVNLSEKGIEFDEIFHIKDLFKSMLKLNEADRPTISQIAKHKAFSKISDTVLSHIEVGDISLHSFPIKEIPENSIVFYIKYICRIPSTLVGSNINIDIVAVAIDMLYRLWQFITNVPLENKDMVLQILCIACFYISLQMDLNVDFTTILMEVNGKITPVKTNDLIKHLLKSNIRNVNDKNIDEYINKFNRRISDIYILLKGDLHRRHYSHYCVTLKDYEYFFTQVVYNPKTYTELTPIVFRDILKSNQLASPDFRPINPLDIVNGIKYNDVKSFF